LNDEELRRKVDSPGNRKADGRYCRSAWTVTDETRELWNRIIGKDELRGVFAGHFHSHARRQYQSFDWVKGPEYPSILSNKLVISPPIAIKDQVRAPQTARGFRDVAIRNDTGAVSSEIIWLEDSPQDAPKALPAEPASSGFLPAGQAPR
jgi:hypothetical protein